MFTSKTESAVLAVDAGTTSIKAAIISDDLGVLAVAERPTPVHSSKPGMREIDMDVFGEHVFAVLVSVLEQVDPDCIVGLAITGQGDGAWLVDEQAHPVGPAILWNDARSAEVLARMQASGEVDRIKESTHGSVHTGSLAVIARHLHENEPQRLAKARHHLHCKDWIRYLLTGYLEAEASDACRSFLNTETRSWDFALIDEMGDLNTNSVLPLAGAGETRALSTTAAQRLNLPSGLPVGVGMMDVAATGYAFCADQLDSAWAIVGTTSFVGTVRSNLEADVGNWMAYGTEGLLVNSQAPITGTPLLEWAKRLVGWEKEDWQSFSDFASRGRSEGALPLLLPYLSPSGERAPFSEPFARGSLHGLTYDTTPENFAWSVFTGIALSIADCMDGLNVSGPVHIAGGGSSSDLLCQLIADYSGCTIERRDLSSETGIIGSVRKLHSSLGIDSKPDTTSVHFESTIDPAQRTDSLARLREMRKTERVNWHKLAGRP